MEDRSYGKYKYGKQTAPISLSDFKKIMEKKKFVKSNYHRSYLAFLYWFGVRRSEAFERVKEDFTVNNGFLVVNCPAKKRGYRKTLKAPVDLPFLNLIIAQVQKTKRGRVWKFSESTAYRIVKRVMPRHYPHFFRLNRAVHFLDDPTTTVPEMQSWFGWRQVASINKYLGYSERHLDRQAERLRSETK